MADYITIPWTSGTTEAAVSSIVTALATDGGAWVLDEDVRLFETVSAGVPYSHVIRAWFGSEMDRLREENAIHEDHGLSRGLMDDRLTALAGDNATAVIAVEAVTSPTTGRKGWRVTWRPALVTALKEDEIMCRLIDAAIVDLQAVLNRQ
tara:strand:+ start:136 stop:585 length:450 start_codon:yes stop_codon:yes gene_type:complete